MRNYLLAIGMIPALLISSITWSQQNRSSSEIRVNQQRIEKRIHELAAFGKDSIGRGYRVAFTQGDIEGRTWFMNQMKNAGLEVSIDAAGNIIGKRKGKNNSLKPIAFGSHIDMVPDGGNYDGCVGSIGALEVIETLNENKIITDHSLELIIFSNEEGGTVGSSAMSGHLTEEGLKTISQSGYSMAEGIRRIGGNPDKIQTAIREKGDIKAFLELHIEQGGFLERDKIQIGVVEGIVGIEHWNVTFEGFANHAGTTPMDQRKDALLSASEFILEVNRIIRNHEGRQVGTVGKISVQPGAFNVIPGKVVAGLEIRDLSYDKVWMLFREIENKTKTIAEKNGVTVSFQQQSLPTLPALTDKSIQDKIVKAAKALGYSYQHMQSGAGHDSQEMARITSVGMIFVPSRGGISHSPKEFTSPPDMANGANVLLQTILLIDKEK